MKDQEPVQPMSAPHLRGTKSGPVVAIPTMRKEYLRGVLDESSVAVDPVAQFALWFEEANAAGLLEANAMTVATAGADGSPSARTVLLKWFDAQGFVFFTNYESPKSRDLNANPRVALLFYWPTLERQVRVIGVAERIDAAESDAYFARRPLGSRISAVASPQSEVIPDRAWLAARFEAVAHEAEATGDVARPPHWGGIRVVPDGFEFWQGRPNRLHDRLQYRQGSEGWQIERLAP